MTPSDRFKVNPKIVSATIDGEVIMLNLDRGRYYSLTTAGTDAWSAIERTAPIGDIVGEVLKRYDGDAAEIERALLRLIGDLRQEDLILPVPPDDASRSPAAAPGRPEASTNGPPPADRRPFEPPVLQSYTDMEDLLLLDPIHEVDATGWPNRRPDGSLPPG